MYVTLQLLLAIIMSTYFAGLKSGSYTETRFVAKA